jgi:hypothetical protein
MLTAAPTVNLSIVHQHTRLAETRKHAADPSDRSAGTTACRGAIDEPSPSDTKE